MKRLSILLITVLSEALAADERIVYHPKKEEHRTAHFTKFPTSKLEVFNAMTEFSPNENSTPSRALGRRKRRHHENFTCEESWVVNNETMEWSRRFLHYEDDDEKCNETIMNHFLRYNATGAPLYRSHLSHSNRHRNRHSKGKNKKGKKQSKKGKKSKKSKKQKDKKNKRKRKNSTGGTDINNVFGINVIQLTASQLGSVGYNNDDGIEYENSLASGTSATPSSGTPSSAPSSLAPSTIRSESSYSESPMTVPVDETKGASDELSKDVGSIVPLIPSSAPTTVKFFKPTTNSSSPLSMPTTEQSIKASKALSSVPTTMHSLTPTKALSSMPTTLDSVQPSIALSSTPTRAHSITPSIALSYMPSILHSITPSTELSSTPSILRSITPSTELSSMPTTAHSLVPSQELSFVPTTTHSYQPSKALSSIPTTIHSITPSTEISSTPTTKNSLAPTISHSSAPSSPTSSPTCTKLTTPPEGGEYVDIFAATGQSNAFYPPWGGNYFFGKGVEDIIVASGRFSNPVVVKNGEPGSSIRGWFFRGRPQYLYKLHFFGEWLGTRGDLEVAFEEVRKAGNTPRFRGLFWFQGETDGKGDDSWQLDTPPADYVKRWSDILSTLETDIGSKDFFFVVNTVGNSGETINQVLRSIADNDERGTIFDTQVRPYRTDFNDVHGYDHRAVGRGNAVSFLDTFGDGLDLQECASFVPKPL